MKDYQELFWFLLFSTPGVGPKKLFELSRKVDELSLLERCRKENLEEIECLKLLKILPPSPKEREKILCTFNELRKIGAGLLTPNSTFYPERLLPRIPILFYKGNLELLQKRGIAIVGARNVSEFGRNISEILSRQIAQKGFNVISGYAKGVDEAAHRASLESQGSTIMVLSYGILHFYLRKSLKEVFDLERTLIVSQFHPREKWRGRNSMTRNLTVVLLSSAVVVIEAGRERDEKTGKASGSFNAGLMALREKIPLFVVSPKAFSTPPPGNVELLKLGGIELLPEEGIDKILNFLTSKRSKQTYTRQPSLFE